MRRHPFHLEIAKRVAKERGGLCLSNQCEATKEVLQWKCSKGHEWSATYNNVIHGKNWCMKCSHRNPYTLYIAKKIAHERNGVCLSDKIINSETPLLWRCDKGHEWNARLSNVKKRNTWCPYCAGRSVSKHSLENARIIAHSRNGKCLSEKYINIMTALLWRCSKGHEWNATLNSIKNANTWCPFCPKYKREKLCREILTEYLGSPSLTRRPEFLKTQEHLNGLELDIFYPQYDFAIEVQGIQHEKYIEFFHRDPKNFIKQQARDQLKKELCEENRIALKYVWYYEDPYVVIPEHLQELGLIK